MSLFSFEHSKRAMMADFVFYGFSIATLLLFLCLHCAAKDGLSAGIFVFAGCLSANVMEYCLHRFVLHQLTPFRDWHLRHHAQPKALMGTPTIASAALIFLLVALPAYLCLALYQALALTLGTVLGYFLYSLTHHAVHQWHGENRWLRTRKSWHALHHHVNPARHFGVSSVIWDYMFGTA
ncbi:sterol desaturase family protein [Undibacterium crateris]|uniref:sterol desaturase family protein n=1 Tax=Undibacterium crateris TaxID=2528175 RepID=UPI0013897EE3|nr:sterol desaturase family protein [Undibacterium crateris]NDI84215.1 hypothetical protein [Undibacterium crateris]